MCESYIYNRTNIDLKMHCSKICQLSESDSGAKKATHRMFDTLSGKYYLD